ncbi:MAG: serine/threonine-protein phosphatase [Desulfobacterales bacterium]|nr:MAG: serine/threonine-protein phosphatase [Desulfobacterales bacterium]
MLLDDTMGLYVVADGMGGHRAGEVASRLVVETLKNFIRKFRENDGAEALIKTDENLSLEANGLLSGILLSNGVVHQASRSNQSYRGMGSTVSAVYFTDETIIAANVGDSPIHLIRDGKITLLSVTHTVLAEQMAVDPHSVELLGNEFQHVLTRAMGVEETIEADIHEIQCFKDDILVLSSDGLSDKASPEEILQVVINQKSDTACRRLVDLANIRGGDDNVTTIVLKVKTLHGRQARLKRWAETIKRRWSNFVIKRK